MNLSPSLNKTAPHDPVRQQTTSSRPTTIPEKLHALTPVPKKILPPQEGNSRLLPLIKGYRRLNQKIQRAQRPLVRLVEGRAR